MGAIPYAIQLLSVIPQLVQAGMDISGLVKDSTEKLGLMQLEKRDPTPAEWDELNAKIAASRKELHAPGA